MPTVVPLMAPLVQSLDARSGTFVVVLLVPRASFRLIRVLKDLEAGELIAGNHDSPSRTINATEGKRDME